MAIYKLNELYEMKSGAPVYKSNFTPEGNVHLLTFLDAFNNYSINNNYLAEKVIFPEEKIFNFSLLKGDILLTTTSETPDELAMSCLVEEDLENIIYNAHLKRLRPTNDKLLPTYAKYLFRSENFRKQVNSKVTMTTRSVFNISIFNSISINIPSIEEQQKIIDIIEPIEKLENRLFVIVNKLKEMMKLEYLNNSEERIFLNELITNVNSKYDGQVKYVATNAISELSLDKEKIIDLENQIKIPSRANVSPPNETIILSKLLGENKIYYFTTKPEEVFSTGFFNFKTKYVDHVVSFLLSNDFISQKELLVTGTTMLALNNKSLNEITLKKPIDSSFDKTNLIMKLDQLKIKLKSAKLNLIDSLFY